MFAEFTDLLQINPSHGNVGLVSVTFTEKIRYMVRCSNTGTLGALPLRASGTLPSESRELLSS